MGVIIDERAKRIVKSLSEIDQARITGYINLFKEYKFTLAGKYLKKLKTNLWELRPGKIRVLFGFINQTMIIVHVFKKQTRKAPLQEIKTAENRIKEYQL